MYICVSCLTCWTLKSWLKIITVKAKALFPAHHSKRLCRWGGARSSQPIIEAGEGRALGFLSVNIFVIFVRFLSCWSRGKWNTEVNQSLNTYLIFKTFKKGYLDGGVACSDFCIILLLKMFGGPLTCFFFSIKATFFWCPTPLRLRNCCQFNIIAHTCITQLTELSAVAIITKQAP